MLDHAVLSVNHRSRVRARTTTTTHLTLDGYFGQLGAIDSVAVVTGDGHVGADGDHVRGFHHTCVRQ